MSGRVESPKDFEIVSKEEVENSQKKDQEMMMKGGGPVQVFFFLTFFFASSVTRNICSLYEYCLIFL